MTTAATPRDAAVSRLRELLSPGDTVYLVIRHTSRSGMLRRIDAYVMAGGAPLWIGRAAADATGRTYSRGDGIACKGAGMDMGFDLVCALGRALWPNGVPCTGRECLSNDHRNGDLDYEVGRIHPNGGYALRHRYL